ncbi:MAG: sugar transferase [Actinobacteria bacterium]|nr:MAG: sugar transferase [Actinomycetota bacterium]
MGLVRRLCDLCGSIVGLILLAPVMALIAVFIKRDSDGPVIFAQERVGRHGRPFTLFKFRTMTNGPAAGPAVTAAGDARVTRVGATLRSTKLDELPQLVNVAKGEMALVGPRPEVRRYVDLWPEEQRRVILSIRPGITDPMTVNLRREEELLGAAPDPEAYYTGVLLPQKAAAYVRYVQSRTLRSDLGLLFTTLWSIARD